MQFAPNIVTFDTEDFSVENPISPKGHLFTYYPSEMPPKFHYHDFFEIGYCESGTGIFNINGEPIPFRGKCVSLVYDGQIHIAQSVSPEKSTWHFLYINLNCLFANSEFTNFSFLKHIKSHHHNHYRFPQILSYNEYPDFYELVKQIIIEGANFNESSYSVLQGLTYTLLKKHERLFLPNTEKVTSSKENRALALELGGTLNYINENYTNTITMEDLINVAKMSKRNLERKMTDYTGKSPMQYIHHLRLQYATALLVDKSNSISNIALEVGYNLSSFNRQFLREYKMSPSEWRKQNT